MTAWRKTNGLCKIEMPVRAMVLKKWKLTYTNLWRIKWLLTHCVTCPHVLTTHLRRLFAQVHNS